MAFPPPWILQAFNFDKKKVAGLHFMGIYSAYVSAWPISSSSSSSGSSSSFVTGTFCRKHQRVLHYVAHEAATFKSEQTHTNGEPPGLLPTDFQNATFKALLF